LASSKKTEREAREARDRVRRYAARQAVHEGQTKRRVRDNLIAVGGILVIAALATTTQVFYFTAGPGLPTPEPSASASDAPTAGTNVGDVPDPSLAEGRTWTGTLTLNDVPLGIELDGALAPQAVASFIGGAESGYYVGKTCHRLVVSEGAGLIQCGSLDGTGATDPSYSFGPVENAPADNVYPAGTIAMARAGNDGYSNGRQFFIVFSDTTLPTDQAGGYTIFGQVTSGLDSLKALITDAGTIGGVADGEPLIPTSITNLTVQ
jgi:peptidyl-prolyl cis-trans isomerase B (cyclophilin B)